MEQFDVLDCAGRKTGEMIGRDEAHASGVWHGAFHCLLLYRRPGQATALFQKRAGAKKIAPAKYDVSVGGHYSAGEDARIAGPREIGEELGLVVPFSSLLPVGRRVFVYCFTPGVHECEFQDIFLLPLPAPPERIVMQPGEVDAVLELAVETGIALFGGASPSATGVLHRADGSVSEEVVAPADFVPNVDNYYLRLLLLARRYFRGESDALIV